MIEFRHSDLIKIFKKINERTLAIDEDLNDDDIENIFRFVFDAINMSIPTIREAVEKESIEKDDYEKLKPYPFLLSILDTRFCIIVGKKKYRYADVDTNDNSFCNQGVDIELRTKNVQELSKKYFSGKIRDIYTDTYVKLVFMTLSQYIENFYTAEHFYNVQLSGFFTIRNGNIYIFPELLNKKYF